MKEKYRDVQKLTDNPFLNLYHIDAVDTDGKDFKEQRKQYKAEDP